MVSILAQRKRDSSETYPPLPLGPGEIRVLQILPRSTVPEVCADLKVVGLFDEERPTYDALSYTWGSSSENRSICINGEFRVRVTDNLHRALQRLRHMDHLRPIWIDAVCIDQSNMAERSAQVALMGKIYSSARQVHVWLGECSRTDLSKSLALLKRQRKGFSTHRLSRFLRRNNSRDPLGPNIEGAMAIEIALSCTVPKWQDRAWIIQEFVMAGNLRFHAGGQEIPHPEDPACLSGMPLEDCRMWFPNLCALANRLHELEDIKYHYRLSFGERGQPRGPIGSDLLRFYAVMSKADATDPRDRVYSVLSLIPDKQSQFIGSNYTIACSEVYARATYACVVSHQDLRALTLVHFDHDRNPNLPSWVIDAEGGAIESADQWEPYPYREDSWKVHRQYARESLSTRDVSSHVSLDVDSKSLVITAHSLDVVTHTMPIPVMADPRLKAHSSHRRVSKTSTERPPSEVQERTSDEYKLCSSIADMIDFIQMALSSAHPPENGHAKSQFATFLKIKLPSQPLEDLTASDVFHLAANLRNSHRFVEGTPFMLTAVGIMLSMHARDMGLPFSGPPAMVERASSSPTDKRWYDNVTIPGIGYLASRTLFPEISANKYLQGRTGQACVFVTRCGLVGLAPSSIGPGDVLVMFPACEPYLI